MGKLLSMSVFKDKEIVPFYWIVLSPGVFLVLCTLLQREWGVSAYMGILVLGFMYLGWPLSAEVNKDGNVLFKGIVRRVHVTPESLVYVKGIGVHDYRAHIAFRVKGDIPLAYRCRKYENRAVLAQAMLGVIEKSTNAKVTDDALKLLHQTAKGSKKPLPLK
jgi:hypothetical protein